MPSFPDLLLTLLGEFVFNSLSSPALGVRDQARARQGVWIDHRACVIRGSGVCGQEWPLAKGTCVGFVSSQPGAAEQGCVLLFLCHAQALMWCQLAGTCVLDERMKRAEQLR